MRSLPVRRFLSALGRGGFILVNSAAVGVVVYLSATDLKRQLCRMDRDLSRFLPDAESSLDSIDQRTRRHMVDLSALRGQVLDSESNLIGYSQAQTREIRELRKMLSPKPVPEAPVVTTFPADGGSGPVARIARLFTLSYLTEHGGCARQNDLLDAAKEFNLSHRAMQAVRRDPQVEVLVERDPVSGQESVVWRLRPTEPEGSEVER